MDSRHLTQLAQIVDSGTLRRAAEKLNVTQPTLTRNMRVLEDRLGAPVLHRTSKGVEPTLIGRRLAEKGHDILTICGSAQEAVNNWHKGQESELRIGVGPMPAVTLFGSFLESHLGERNSYSLHLEIAQPSHLVAMVDEGKIDVAVATVQLTHHYPSLVQIPLFKDEIGVMVRRQHPVAKLVGPALIDALGNQQWITVGSAGLDDASGSALQKIGIACPSPALVISGGFSTVLHLLHNTDMVAAIPKSLTRLHPQGKQMCALPIIGEFPRRDLALWIRSDDVDKKDFVSFIDSMKSYMRQAGLA